MSVTYTTTERISTNGGQHVWYSPNPEPKSKHRPYARMTVTGILHESKHLVTVPYLLREGMGSLVRIGRIFGPIFKTEWEWFK